MAKRKTSVSPKKMPKGPHKTAKRKLAKNAMLKAKKVGTKKRAR